MIAPKVILITMFEPEGETPGELHPHRERLGLQPMEIAGLPQLPVFANEQRDVLAVVIGVGTANAAVSIMALGACAELDLRQTYFVIAGIAGGSPYRCTLGSVGFAEWCVDGDLAYEFDAREMPADWETGILPLGAREPYGESGMDSGLFGRPYQVFQLNETALKLALEACEGLELATCEECAKAGREYGTDTAAAQPVSVFRGDSLATARFWHGVRFNEWAEKWVEYWTQGKGTFATSGMEDTGTLHALEYLALQGRVDQKKVILIRGVSNYTLPPPGVSVVDSLCGEADKEPNFPGFALALENLGRVGVRVVDALR